MARGQEKKPTPTTLFDDRDREDYGHKKWAESQYGFLNRRAGQNGTTLDAKRSVGTRSLMTLAAICYAVFFAEKEDEQHLPAWWELYVHQLFVRLGYEVAVHPQLPRREERPDFLVTRGTESLYVEATTVFNGDYNMNPHGQAWVQDFIDSAQNPPDFMVDIEFPRVAPPTGWPRRREIVDPLEQWLARLDWAEARADWESNGIGYMSSPPRWRWNHECGDWTIAYLATPVQAESRRKGRRLIAIPATSAANFSHDIQRIRTKLNEKGGNKYSSLDGPLEKNRLSSQCNCGTRSTKMIW